MHILVDIGGTKTRVAASRDLERFDEPIILDTPQDDDVFLETITRSITEAAAGEAVSEIAIGKPHWRRRQGIADELAKRLPAPIRFENDTALVGLGEAHFGAGKGATIFTYITISTGVNGVRIVDGRIDRSAQGFEIGGQYLGIDTAASWEEMISGRAIQKRFGIHPKELGKEHEVWEELARVAAIGIHNTILHWSPERLAIGGSMMNEIGIPVDRIRFHLEAIMRKFPALPEIVHSELGDLGGLWGGLALLRQDRA